MEGDDDLNTDWLLFLDRFRRSLRDNGFSNSLSAALSKALGEMTDNVVQHSGTRGVAVFHVGERWTSWGVADIGRGVLNSLKTNPKWHRLAGSQEALLAVWRDGATRRVSPTRGDGFRQVELSLASLNGRLRFRSGDAVLVLDGTHGTPKSIVRANPELAGVQVSATCALDFIPEKISITY